MVKHRSLCIVIADGGQARFVRPAADNALHTQEALESATLHQQTGDLVSDRPGRSFESANAARHALAPHNDPHTLEKGKFARLVGEKIRTGARAGSFDELLLVAPPPVLSELREALDVETERLLIGTLSKDLVKVPDDELQPHLKQWVRPVHRA